MQISETQAAANILTKCSKMSDTNRIHGISGNAEKTVKEEFRRNNYGQGARLKFFKDGKFILELERTLEGERVSWVSVHQKTYWPPQSTVSLAPSYQQESTTSLSVSDDNSSMQSSPWQRDHSWKQNRPCRNISSEMNLYFWKPKSMRLGRKRRKRRSPYSSSSDFKNDYATFDENVDKFKKKCGKKSLMAMIQTLIDKNFQTSKQPRTEIAVSPRKRFLREMEMEKMVVGDNCQKRSRSKTQTFTTSSPSSYASSSKSVLTNGIESNGIPTTRNCSYSINSLLTDDYVHKKSPNESPCHNTPMTRSLHYSPLSEDRWYSESLDRLRCIELTHAENRNVSPSYHSRQAFAAPNIYSFQPIRSYYGPGLYDRGYFPPSIYHGSPLPLGIRQEDPSSFWGFEEEWKWNRGNAVADKPLNLSKHPG